MRKNEILLKKTNQLNNILPIISVSIINNELILNVENRFLLFVVKMLKLHISYNYRVLTSISGVDLLSTFYRFSVVYDFLDLDSGDRIRLKTFVNEATYLPTIIPAFINANWWEREVWDMFGVYFEGHPELRRILTDYGFEGYPLRKDFPLVGFTETRYLETEKRVEIVPLSLAQEMRPVSFESSWNVSYSS